jgi:AcrR family transcriptional regulator
LNAHKRPAGRPRQDAGLAGDPEGRRQELVRAAYRRIAESGFEGLRTRDVAAEVGVNVATLHYYFPTKEALIRSVVGYAMGRFRATLEPGAPPGEQLAAYFAGVRRLFRDEPELFAVMGELAQRSDRDPVIAAIFKEMNDVWHATVRGLLQHARTDGFLAPDLEPDAVAALVIATFKGMFMLPVAITGQERLELALSQLEQFLGIGKPAASRRRVRAR